jgi:hypothetical protein
MLYKFETLDNQVESMKKMAVILCPYSHPKVKNDEDISYLKQREIVIDGYTVVISYSRSDYEGMYLDIVSFTGRHMPFLPMPLICKIGKRFLGDKELTFSEFLKSGRKFYSWMVLYKANGTPISNNFVQNGINDSFNGLEFTRCNTQNAVQAPPI